MSDILIILLIQHLVIDYFLTYLYMIISYDTIILCDRSACRRKNDLKLYSYLRILNPLSIEDLLRAHNILMFMENLEKQAFVFLKDRKYHT